MIRLRSPFSHPFPWNPCLVLALAASTGAWASHEPAPASEVETSAPHAHESAPVVPAAAAETSAHSTEPAAHATPVESADAAHAPESHAGKTPAPAHAVASPAKVSTLSEEEVRSMLKLGATMTDRGDFDAAEIAFRQVMKADGVPLNDVKTALLGLARMHRKKEGDLTKAAAIYEKYLKEFPGDDRTPDALLDLGRTLRALGAYDLAISRFYNVINSTLKLPSDGFDHYQLLAKTAQFEIAETHFQAGNFEEAGKFFARLRLLDLAPSDRARAHFKAAYSQHLQNNNETAVATLRTFLEQWPEDENVPEARYLLAISLRALNRRQEAFSVTLELLRTEKSRVEADPKRWAYWQRRTGNQLANDFYESGDTLNAHAIYAGLAALSTEPVWRLPILYQVALCHERLGNVERARSTYQDIVQTAGPAPAAEVAELARMAAWRLAHLEWHDQVGKQVSTLFQHTTGRAPSAVLPAPAKTSALP